MDLPRWTTHAGSFSLTLNRFVDVMKTAGLPDFQQMPAALDFLGQTIVLQTNTLAFRDGFLVVTLIFIAALAPTWVLNRATRGAPR